MKYNTFTTHVGVFYLIWIVLLSPALSYKFYTCPSPFFIFIHQIYIFFSISTLFFKWQYVKVEQTFEPESGIWLLDFMLSPTHFGPRECKNHIYFRRACREKSNKRLCFLMLWYWCTYYEPNVFFFDSVFWLHFLSPTSKAQRYRRVSCTCGKAIKMYLKTHPNTRTSDH